MFKPEELGVLANVLSEFKGDGPTVVYAHKVFTKIGDLTSSSDPAATFTPEEAAFLIKQVRNYKSYPLQVAPLLQPVDDKLVAIINSAKEQAAREQESESQRIEGESTDEQANSTDSTVA